MATLLDGRAVAAKLRVEIAQDVAAFTERHGRAPSLTGILVGEDPPSKVYIRRIAQSCADVKIRFTRLDLPAFTTERELRQLLLRLNADEDLSGIIVQMPLPEHISPNTVATTLAVEKDVDGVCPANAGCLLLGLPALVPATPFGGFELLKRYGVVIRGADAVIVGRSPIVGKPMAALLLNDNASVSICHSRTRDLRTFTRRADILVAAVGRPKIITADMVKPGAAVVDFGINLTAEGIVGDVDFGPVAEIASCITPVPGGTGPMTNVILMRNTLTAAQRLAGELIHVEEDI